VGQARRRIRCCSVLEHLTIYGGLEVDSLRVRNCGRRYETGPERVRIVCSSRVSRFSRCISRTNQILSRIPTERQQVDVYGKISEGGVQNVDTIMGQIQYLHRLLQCSQEHSLGHQLVTRPLLLCQ